VTQRWSLCCWISYWHSLTFAAYITIGALWLFQAETQSDHVHATATPGIGVPLPKDALSRRFPPRGSRPSDIALGSTCPGKLGCFAFVSIVLFVGKLINLDVTVLFLLNISPLSAHYRCKCKINKHKKQNGLEEKLKKCIQEGKSLNRSIN